MTKIFIDVNILQDILGRRKNWFNSLAIINLVKQERIKASISTLSVAILWFLNSKAKGIKNQIHLLTNFIDLVNLDAIIIKKALQDKKFRDFEDAIQYFSAKQNKCKIIITRNKKDFPVKDVQILSPEEFLEIENQDSR